MRFHEFTEMIDAGEGLTVEFKRRVSSPEKIAREIIAFANTRGGTLFFGVDDDKSIVGVESEKAELEEIHFAADRLCEPSIRHDVQIFHVHSVDVICITVPESDRKPHFLVGDDGEKHSFVRVGESSVQASREMIRIMRHSGPDASPVRLVYGEAEKRLFQWFESHERITVREYSKLINVSERRASRLLVRLVRTGAIIIHTHEKTDFFTIAR